MRKQLLAIFLSWCALAGIAMADNDNSFNGGMNGFGQSIQIYTQLNSFVGKPRWLIMIRDLDHNQNIPFVYDITRGDNFWLAFTYSRNYLVLASTMKITTYSSRLNGYYTYEIRDFCHLESHGRIRRAESLYLTIKGDLSPNTDTYSCHLSHFRDSSFSGPSY